MQHRAPTRPWRARLPARSPVPSSRPAGPVLAAPVNSVRPVGWAARPVTRTRPRSAPATQWFLRVRPHRQLIGSEPVREPRAALADAVSRRLWRWWPEPESTGARASRAGREPGWCRKGAGGARAGPGRGREPVWDGTGAGSGGREPGRAGREAGQSRREPGRAGRGASRAAPEPGGGRRHTPGHPASRPGFPRAGGVWCRRARCIRDEENGHSPGWFKNPVNAAGQGQRHRVEERHAQSNARAPAAAVRVSRLPP